MEGYSIVEVDGLVMQAHKAEGMAATRRKVEQELEKRRDAMVKEHRAQGRRAVRWGYAERKTLRTPVGDLGPLRVPRLRVDGEERRIIPRQVRCIASFESTTAEVTLGGISQRRTGGFLGRAYGIFASAGTVGRIGAELGERTETLRETPLSGAEYVALAVDGVWGKYRGAGEAALLVGMGVRWDGSFEALDWEACGSESAENYEKLFTRLWERGLRPGLVVADGCVSIRSAVEMVYPEAEFQLCLWHWWRTLRRLVSSEESRRFGRDFWEVYNGLDRVEVVNRARAFRREWGRRCGAVVSAFEERFEATLGFLRYPSTWRHRLRTVNLAEGFFRNFRRFFNRWPGFKDAAHLAQVMGLYLLSAKPERLRMGGWMAA